MPEVGVVYKGSRVVNLRYKCELCGSSVYYHIPSLGNNTMHSRCVFEVLPDDVLANLKSEIQPKTQDHGIKLENYTTS